MWCETRGQDEGQGQGTLAEDFVGFFWGFLKPLGTLDTAKMEHFRDSNSFELHQFWETPNFSKLTFCFPEFSWREICPGKYHPQRSCHFGALIAPPSYLLLVDEGYATGCHQYYFIFDINVVNLVTNHQTPKTYDRVFKFHDQCHFTSDFLINPTWTTRSSTQF
jgi:hypothetical protein